MMARVLIVAIALLTVPAAAPQTPQASQPPASSPQQWTPPDPMNLQVLPKSISKGDLVGTMKSFTRALGVRCEFCHAGEAGAPLETFDFASDDKEEKGTARTMLRMVADINGKYLANVGEPRAAGNPAVTCYTCHRGSRTPLTAPEPKG